MLLNGGAFAGQIFASSYSMPNGFYNTISGTFYDFEDTIYTPCPLGVGHCTDATHVADIGAALSGGLGKLTDGITSNLSYTSQGTSTPTYVGWFPNATYNGVDPTVSFYFGATTDTVVQIGIHVDNNYQSGGGDLVPASVTIDGTTFQVITAGNLATYESTPGPVWLYFTVSDLINSSHPLTVQFNQEQFLDSNGNPTCCSVMVDEVTFADASGLPEPATWSLFAGGLAALVALARKRKR